MFYFYRGSLKSREKFLRFVIGRILLRAWFSPASSAKKIARRLLRWGATGLPPCRVTRRANALVLLDKGSPKRCSLTTPRFAAGASSSNNARS